MSSTSAPDPGEEVTVTVYIENAGTTDTEEVVDVAIFANGEKIGGEGIEVLNPVDPSVQVHSHPSMSNGAAILASIPSN